MRARQSKGPAEFTLAMIGGGWKIPLIFHRLAGDLPGLQTEDQEAQS